jgi:abhydrolase domain-containing protein 17
MEKGRLRKLLVGDFTVRRLLRSLVLIPVLIYVALFLFAIFFSDRLIFQPHPSSYVDDPSIIKIRSKNGSTISAVYLPNMKARYTLLYSHGNAEDIGDSLPVFEDLRSLGFSVFAYDYQGYGTSEGVPSEQNACEDVEAAYKYLTETLGIQADRIIAYGHSLGGALAIEIASRKPVAGLVIESTFTTAFRVLTRIPILPFDKFRSIDKIASVSCPVLVIHGKLDNMIVPAHGEALFENVAGPRQMIMVERAGHVSARMSASKRFLSAMNDLGFPTN